MCFIQIYKKWWLLTNHMLLLPQFIQVTIECLAEVSNDWDFSVCVLYFLFPVRVSFWIILFPYDREKLAKVWDEIIVIEEITSGDEEKLALINRPELGVTFSKLHIWRLVHYSKCVYLDADTLVMTNVDELFEREELSAAPDIGWPDLFNSGVFVFRPSLETYSSLSDLANKEGSYDGIILLHTFKISFH